MSDSAGHLRPSRVVRAAVLGPYVEAARGAGLDARHMVEKAGLPLLALDQPDLQIPAAGLIDLLRASALACGREDFGLLVADAFKVSMLGALGLLIREQQTVGAAIEVFAQFSKYTTNTLSVWVETLGDEVVVHPILFGRPPRGDPIAVDMVMGDIVKVLRSLLGADWRPRRVCLARRSPSDPLPYRQRFGAVEFDHVINGVFLAAADLDTPIPNADPDMAREISRYILANGNIADASLTDQVAALIVEMLPSGACSVEHVAERLGVDRRTIHRRLALEGQSFSGLVEQRRRDLVKVQLSQPGRPLSSVAGMLGFSSLSTFSRWYRNAFGGTARQSRGAMARGATTSDPTIS